MAQGVGARWASQVPLVSVDTQDYYGATGSWLTHEQIDADEAANKVFRIYPGNKSTLMIKPLQTADFNRGSAGVASGPRIEVYGVLGFGELDSRAWFDNKLLAIRLGAKGLLRGNRSNADVSNATKTIGPDGQTFHGMRQDVYTTVLTAGGAGEMQQEFIAIHSLEAPNDTPHAGVSASGGVAGTYKTGSTGSGGSGGDGGFITWQGCDSFQMMLFVHDKMSFTTSFPNFVINMH